MFISELNYSLEYKNVTKTLPNQQANSSTNILVWYICKFSWKIDVVKFKHKANLHQFRKTSGLCQTSVLSQRQQNAVSQRTIYNFHSSSVIYENKEIKGKITA